MIEGKRRHLNEKYAYALLLLAGWTIIGLISTGQLYTASYLEGDHLDWRRILIWQMSPWYLWVFLTPLVRHFGRRIRITARRWVRPVLHHLVISSLVSIFALLILITIRCRAPLDPANPVPFTTMAVSMTGSSLHINLLIYWMILGLGYAFDFRKQARERENLALSLEKQLAQAQLQALRMQIQPHFLFNTLNAITVLVRDQKNQAAVRMLTGISDLLRIVLSQNNSQMATLQEEMEFIRRYLNIEQARFEDRLQLDIELAPETLPALVPNFILQPLVENALKHGISQMTSNGVIKIRSMTEGDMLQLSVSNNGPALAGSEATSENSGIGLKNIRARLERLYGASQQLTLNGADGFGVIAVIRIPFTSIKASDSPRKMEA
jgi:two-component system, LytTR family, sensor kinase